MDVFTRINQAMDQVLDGWCTVEKAHLLAGAILTLKAQTVVEIGVWAGRSLIPMALACQEMKFGKVIGIDPWSTEASVAGMEGPDMAWWKGVSHDDMYRKFLQHLDRFELRDYVTIHRNRSDEVEPPERIDLLHIDGNHSEQAIRDAERFAPRVRLGGVVFCDDIGWVGGAVKTAIGRITQMGFEQTTGVDNGAFFVRTSTQCC